MFLTINGPSIGQGVMHNIAKNFAKIAFEFRATLLG